MTPTPAVPRWAWAGLSAVLLFDVWWRGHTFGPTIRDGLGVVLWPVVRGETEPLDCDEAIYAYIGKRLTAGDAMYRDLTENKPPVGYWLYGLAVAVGGANERTIRLLPLPLVLATIGLVWWIGLRVGGPQAAVLAAVLYALTSTDPYLYGNGMQLELPINLFATAALALVLCAPGQGLRRRLAVLLLAGACLGLACLVRQVAILHAPVFAAAVWARPEHRGRRVGDLAWLGFGCILVWLIAAAVLAGQGALGDAYEDVIRYGAALATDVPAEPNAPPLLVRWFTGNADPHGRLPPPFGKTDYLVWWGSGSWPLWLAAVPGLVWLLRGAAGSGRRLVAFWTLSAWVQVALPRQFWAHYYLMPLPGLSVAVAVLAADAARGVRSGHPARRLAWGTVGAGLLAAVAATAVIQVRDYLLTPPGELTEKFKGGGQWLFLRELGRDLARRTRSWDDARLYVWGIQSPLYVYSGLDGVTRQVFADNLIKEFADRDHPLVRPRIERTVRDLRERRPALIFAGYRPFAGLRQLLLERYEPVPMTVGGRTIPILPNGLGLWVERDRLPAVQTPAD